MMATVIYLIWMHGGWQFLTDQGPETMAYCRALKQQMPRPPNYEGRMRVVCLPGMTEEI